MNNIYISKTDYYISKNVSARIQTSPRTTDTYEIELYTTSGNKSVVNGISYPQTKGNILVSKPGDLRYSINSFECYYTHFICDIPEICTELNRLPTVFESKNPDRITDIFKNIISSQKMQGISKNLYIQGNMTQLIGLLIYENTVKYSGKYKQYIKSIDKCCDYMKKNMESPITLSDISKQISLSPGFFHKVFKEVKGLTPLEYLTKVRINSAKNMLKNSNISLSEIAILCGFNSQAYFNYVFLKQTSVTPKQYRDKNRIII